MSAKRPYFRMPRTGSGLIAINTRRISFDEEEMDEQGWRAQRAIFLYALKRNILDRHLPPSKLADGGDCSFNGHLPNSFDINTDATFNGYFHTTLDFGIHIRLDDDIFAFHDNTFATINDDFATGFNLDITFRFECNGFPFGIEFDQETLDLNVNFGRLVIENELCSFTRFQRNLPFAFLIKFPTYVWNEFETA